MCYRIKVKSRIPLFILVFLIILIPLLLSGCTTKNQNPNANAGEFIVPEDTFNADNLQGSTVEEAFSLDQSLYRVGQVREGLSSFRKLTEQGKTKFKKDILDQIGNTGWEVQTLGFHNWPNTIEGTLRLQDYQIKKLEFALAVERYEKGKIAKDAVEQAQKTYNDAKSDMQEFLDSYSIAD